MIRRIKRIKGIGDGLDFVGDTLIISQTVLGFIVVQERILCGFQTCVSLIVPLELPTHEFWPTTPGETVVSVEETLNFALGFAASLCEEL